MNRLFCLAFVLGAFVLVGGLWAADELQPIPEPSPAAAQPATSQGMADEEEEEECEFESLSVCSPPGRFWLRADYLMWWTNGTRLPPLAATGPLDVQGVEILYGNRTVNNGGRSGYRATLGMWLDCCHTWDLEFDYFSLGEMASNYTSPFSTGNPTVVRPYFNVWTNRQDGELVAYTGQVEGTVSVRAKDYFQSAGVSLSYNLCSGDMCCSCDSGCDDCCVPTLNCCRTDLIMGFRHYNLSDRVSIYENLRITQPGPTYNTRFLIHDDFGANNNFYGSELGLRTRIYRGRWSVEIMTKIALGNNHQPVDIYGQEIKTPPVGPTETYYDGIFAGPSNKGTYHRDTFTMIPQLNLELGYQINCHLRAYVGYSIMYWGCVARAADQIDLNVDPRNWPGEPGGLPFPAFPGKTSCFYAQGINVGTELRF